MPCRSRLLGVARLVAAATGILLIACGCTTGPAASSTTGDRATASASAEPTADRPYEVVVPSSYRSSVPAPLVILLHGYGSSGAEIESVFGLQPLAEARGFLLVHPNGTVNADGDRFWNATDACCGPESGVDDVAYLTSLIDQVSASYRVDPARVFLFGVSNGGFMAYRMACERADRIAAIVSLAGATFLDASACDPSRPVGVLQIHGTGDRTVPYGGGSLIAGRPFPSAATTVATWASYNGCRAQRVDTGSRLDLAADQRGPETVVSRFAGCPAGGTVELWTVRGADHILATTDDVTPAVVDFLLSHPRP